MLIQGWFRVYLKFGVGLFRVGLGCLFEVLSGVNLLRMFGRLFRVGLWII
jgi:hypothetical protein